MLEPAPVSVVIPCFRCTVTLPRAVESALNQTWPPAEIVLVDDRSEDGTGDLLLELARLHPSIHAVLLSQNHGPAGARNVGWQRATQKYIAFLDADDAWHPRKLELQIAWMEAHAEASLSGTLTEVVQSLSELPEIGSDLRWRELTKTAMLLGNPLPTRSVVLRADVALRFIPDKRYAEDYFLWVSMFMTGRRLFLLEAPLAFSFKHDFGMAGLSSHLWRMQREMLDCYRRFEAAGWINPAIYALLVLMSWAKFLRRLMVRGWWWATGRDAARGN